MSLRRDQLVNAIGADPITIKEFERVLGAVQANIAGGSAIALDYTSAGVLVTPLPALYSYTLAASDGSTFKSGVSWGVVVVSGSFAGAAPTVGGTGTGILQINSGLASNSVTLAMTARVNGRGYPPFNVTLTKNIAATDGGGGGLTATDAVSTFTAISSGTFAPVTRDLVVTLPAAVTMATLTAASLNLRLNNAAPDDFTRVELKWQRETAPSVWADVGAFATSSPDPFVTQEFDPPLFIATAGAVTCNRSETGMTAATQQKFRLVGRVSAGIVRNVTITGTASVAS